jgi:hypothetical protein
MKEVNKITPWTGETLDPITFLNEVKRVMNNAMSQGVRLDMMTWGKNITGNSLRVTPCALDNYKDYKEEIQCGYSCCMLGWCGSDSFFNSMGLYLNQDLSISLLKSNEEIEFQDNITEFTGLPECLFWALFDSEAWSRSMRLFEHLGYCIDDDYFCEDEFSEWLVHQGEEHFKKDHDDYVYAIDAIDYVIKLLKEK